MKVNGSVVALNNKDKLIAKFSRELDIGSEIFDNRNQKIGEIKWIFGPYDDPFYEIQTHGTKKRLSISNKILYAEEDSKNE